MDLTQDDVIRILKLIDEAPVGRVNLQLGEFRLEVVKGEGLRSPSVAAQSFAAGAAVQAVSVSPTVREETPAAAPLTDDEAKLPKITAPILGTFYRRPQPGAPPYVEEGSVVEADTTVALIEVMKLFNPVKAGKPGRIHKICVENGQLVQYGQTLFLLQPE
jgi:acetyl-CoA carboxylase biotin carboxyl carrier protein